MRFFNPHIMVVGGKTSQGVSLPAAGSYEIGYDFTMDVRNNGVLTYNAEGKSMQQPGSSHPVYHLTHDIATATALRVREMIVTCDSYVTHDWATIHCLRNAAEQVSPPLVSEQTTVEHDHIGFEFKIVCRSLTAKTSAESTIYIPFTYWKASTRGMYQHIKFHRPSTLEDILTAMILKPAEELESTDGTIELPVRLEINVNDFKNYVNTLASYIFTNDYLEV